MENHTQNIATIITYIEGDLRDPNDSNPRSKQRKLLEAIVNLFPSKKVVFPIHFLCCLLCCARIKQQRDDSSLLYTTSFFFLLFSSTGETRFSETRKRLKISSFSSRMILPRKPSLMWSSDLFKVVYILDQVRALEEELIHKIELQGIDVKPQILVACCSEILPIFPPNMCDKWDRPYDVCKTHNGQ
ncbi:hypothetical protein JHK86_010275 [Glycine max]|nr:hypothetical protein JHK86_010275 [Glycine max]